MTKSLIIVESPTKIKTLRKFLNDGSYTFASSVGHIRDLPPKKFGIDVEGDFEPQYETLDGKKDVVSALKKAAKAADIVYLAPDPDREGEAIAWHLAEILPPSTKFKRTTFNAITKEAVLKAINEPRDINMDLVNAQQARRLLDRIVGYKISPILHRRINKGKDGFLSAGRVQSVTLKIIVDRERLIKAFIPTEYWSLSALLVPECKQKFEAQLYSVDGLRVEKEDTGKPNTITIPNEEVAREIKQRLDTSTYEVASITTKEKKRYPTPPFITSTLQQEASRHYGFNAQRTMRTAQSLYEGVDIGNETVGLITYMRTDSVRIEPTAISSIRSYIAHEFGKEYLPAKPNGYATKKSAQDAHEAIRPTTITLSPEEIKNNLTVDQYKLYSLIWKRCLASQMTPAVYDTVAATITASNNCMLKANGSVIRFNGFLKVYEEKSDDISTATLSHQDTILPHLVEQQTLEKENIKNDQKFTKPPARFTEASLVKELEKQGIGRPSTYATIMNKIQSKEYTAKEKSTIIPTELGTILCEMLETNFSQIMDVAFTAKMETDLDTIENGSIEWRVFLKTFWDQFIPFLEEAEKNAHVPKIDTSTPCPKCGAHLQKIWASRKYFFGCSAYPECDHTAPLEQLELNKDEYEPSFDWDQSCPKCQKEMKVRSGKFGVFLGCGDYPTCKGIVNIPKKGEALASQLPSCPAIGCNGELTQRRSRFGKLFLSCTAYPECDVIGNSVDEVIEKYKDRPQTKPPEKKKKAVTKKTTTKKTTTKKTSTKKTVAKKEAKPRNHKSYAVSSELQKVIGTSSTSRPEATKLLWTYIKDNNLQDEKNKRIILPDDNLSKVFSTKEGVDMMKIAKHLSSHLSDSGEK